MQSGLLETTPAAVWDSVRSLWQCQRAGQAPWGLDWCLIQASGHVQSGSTVYDLSIFGFLHRRIDLGEVALGELVDRARDVGYNMRTNSGERLRFHGTLEGVMPREGFVENPAVGLYLLAQQLQRLGPVSRWQWWREHRGIWGPIPYGMRGGVEVRCEADGVYFRSAGIDIARWCDWVDGLTETQSEHTSPATGQYLLVRRDLIERFEQDSKTSLCWVAQLTASYRMNGYGDPEVINTEQAYGISEIVLPG